MARAFKDKADLAVLGDYEFEKVEDLFKYCETGRVVCSNGGLIIAQSAYDIKEALREIRSGWAGRRGAARVSRHAFRASDHLRAAQAEFARLPRVFVAEYQSEIQAARPRRRAMTF
jgi:hypothetical protein